jgi:hypothetical protein
MAMEDVIGIRHADVLRTFYHGGISEKLQQHKHSHYQRNNTLHFRYASQYRATSARSPTLKTRRSTYLGRYGPNGVTSEASRRKICRHVLA